MFHIGKLLVCKYLMLQSVCLSVDNDVLCNL
jgi:hypothetical protein